VATLGEFVVDGEGHHILGRLEHGKQKGVGGG
jgi:hypothetical protein